MTSPLSTPDTVSARIPPSRIELFSSYAKLAARVTNLRTILQNDPEEFPLTQEDCQLWVDDVRSILLDFTTLTHLTSLHFPPRAQS